MNATTLEVRYRARTHDANDEALLRRQFESVAAVRLRPLHLPEAGGSFEIWLLVSFVGSNIASGLIGHAAGKWYDDMADRLGRFIAHKVEKDQPPDMTVTFSYDDVDVRVPLVTADELDVVRYFADQIRDHLQSPALRDNAPTLLVIGMTKEDGDAWYEPFAADGLEPDRRFWGVSLETHRSVSHITIRRIVLNMLEKSDPQPVDPQGASEGAGEEL